TLPDLLGPGEPRPPPPEPQVAARPPDARYHSRTVAGHGGRHAQETAMSEQSQPPWHGRGESAAPPPGVVWSPAMYAALFDPESWRESLDAYAQTTNLAVALVDLDRPLLGPCHNPRATWSRLHDAPEGAGGGCPFALAPPRSCTCVRNALAQRALVVKRDRTGLVHFTVPLVLDDHPVGALLAGQVFDQYP